MEINAGSYVYPASSLTYKNENPLSTCHHAESIINREFQEVGDRLKEDFHFYM